MRRDGRPRNRPAHGSALAWPWALPFLGILLTIALMPSMAPRLWGRHYGKVAFVWAALAVVVKFRAI